MKPELKKCIYLFAAFILLVALGPFALGQQSKPIANTELSANSFIRFKDNINLKCRDPKNLKNVKTILGAGSVLQLPAGVTEYNDGNGGDGSINFNETLVQWQKKANVDPQYIHHRARYVDCGGNGRDVVQCSGTDTSEPMLPIKVARASDPTFDNSGFNGICYVALDYLKRNVSRSRYQTVRTNLQSALAITNESDNGETVISGGEETAGDFDTGYIDDSLEVVGGDEVTSVETITNPIDVSLRPHVRPDTYSGFRCSDTQYISSGYQNNNCFARANLTQKQKVEIIMKDVIEINRLRGDMQIDPRFSACVANRESQLSPNAKGGTPDYGLYQIINSTAKRALEKENPVTPGFSVYRHRWAGTSSQPGYREMMLTSTLAQADLHHSVITGIAKWKGQYSRLRGPISSHRRVDYYNIARIYNGGNSYRNRLPTCYGTAIISCYDKMKSAATSSGRVFDSNKLATALHAAKARCR